MIEKCAICQKVVVERDQQHKIVVAQPHTQCRSCGAIVCADCAAETQCPACGFNGKS